jgi:hypothetical protein
MKMEPAGCSECCNLSTELHDITSQKTVLFSHFLKYLKSHKANYDELKIGASLWIAELCHFTLEIHKTVYRVVERYILHY